MKNKHEILCFKVNEKNQGQPGTDELISVRHHSRSRLACDSCRRKKLKCNNETPCQTCITRKIKCTTSSTSRRPGRPRLESSSSSIVDEPTWPTYNEEEILDRPVYPDVVGTVEESANQSTQEHPTTDLGSFPEHDISQDFMFHSDSVPGFDSFGYTAHDLDFMNSLWTLPPLTFDASIDEGGFPLFDNSWLQLPGTMPGQPTDRALDMMREHFSVRSRAPSPSRVDTGQQKYSVAPNLARYDADIINVFLNLARTHLADCFPIFAAFQALPDTPVELLFAMAAVGALYCAVPGSMKIARSLYHDARRLHLETYFTDGGLDDDKALNQAITFILLELYGLCSGDKRSYEFTEVWHGSLLDAAAHYLAVAAAQSDQAQDLRVSVQMLESYRVLILSLPPSITKATDACDDVALGEIMSPSSLHSSQQTSPAITDLVRLAGVVDSGPQDWYKQLWRTEFIELALDRWMRLQQQNISLAQTLLFHMTHIYLHSSITPLQRYAMAQATSQTILDIPDEIRSWVASRDYEISRWHAEKILAATKQMSIKDKVLNRLQDSSGTGQPPHLPYCLYFAILVIWYGTVGPDTNAMAEGPVRQGIEILSGLKVHVAKLLTMAMREIRGHESQDDD